MTQNEFLDIRRHGFYRVGVVVPKIAVADPQANVAFHVAALQKTYDDGVQYAVCPELGLTSYSCGDLFHNAVLQKAALEALGTLVQKSTDWPDLIFTVGLPVAVDNLLFNCGATVLNGRILGLAVKSYPPEYREFYELRHFHPAADLRHQTVTICGQEVPVGNDILMRSTKNPLAVIHVDVCEDIWTPLPPGTRAALAGATVLANLSASNITIAKEEYRESLVLASSGRNLAVQLYSAAGFGESSTDLSWDGDGLIAERGSLLARTERYRLDGQHITADVDLQILGLERMRQSSFGQNARDNASVLNFREVTFTEGETPAARHALFQEFRRQIPAAPAVPDDSAKRDVRCRETFAIQSTALARRLIQLPEARRKIVIGVSGGLDSTHALLVAAKTMDLLGLPRKNILATTMPGYGTTGATYHDSVDLIKAIGAEFREIGIKDLCELTFKGIDFDPVRDGTEPVAYDNVQAWARKHYLFSLSAWHGGIVLGTGDLSELLQGWCTYGADHFSHYGVNAGVFKTLMQYLIRYVSEVEYAGKPEVQALLDRISRRPYSPELKPPTAEGGISQMTEAEIGPYELHDFTGYWMIRFGLAPSRIVRMALHAFAGRYDLKTIRSWQEKFLRRFFVSQFKRSVLADGPKVGLTSVSPRGDWRMPSDASAEAWLRDLKENVPE
jgi:NAD+ synthase (glutamine-hydrolysing)